MTTSVFDAGVGLKNDEAIRHVDIDNDFSVDGTFACLHAGS